MTKVDESPQISFRAMTSADLPAIMALEVEIFSDDWPEQAFSDILSDSSWQTVVAHADSTIVGYACWVVVGVESHLANIAVTAKHRRKSVAKRMLQRILESVRGCGCDCLLLEVRPSNLAAIAFYERHGFEILCRQPGYYQRPVEDAFVMVHYLLVQEG